MIGETQPKIYYQSHMTDNQLSQFESLRTLSKQIEEVMWDKEINEWRCYQRFHMENHISPSKMKQYNSAMSRALEEAKNRGEEEINFFEEWKIRFFIISEWIVENWAIRHSLNHLDHNLNDPYSPQDCNIEGIDILSLIHI